MWRRCSTRREAGQGRVRSPRLSSACRACLRRRHLLRQPSSTPRSVGARPEQPAGLCGRRSGDQRRDQRRTADERLRRAMEAAAVHRGGAEPSSLLGELAHAGGGQGFRVDGAAEVTERARAGRPRSGADHHRSRARSGAGSTSPSSAPAAEKYGARTCCLARTHHDLPKRAIVRGRIGGEASSAMRSSRGGVARPSCRVCGRRHVQRCASAAAGSEAERGRIVALGVNTGWSLLHVHPRAESEQAYRHEHPAHTSPLRGVRLGALDRRGERNVASIANGTARGWRSAARRGQGRRIAAAGRGCPLPAATAGASG